MGWFSKKVEQGKAYVRKEGLIGEADSVLKKAQDANGNTIDKDGERRAQRLADRGKKLRREYNEKYKK